MTSLTRRTLTLALLALPLAKAPAGAGSPTGAPKSWVFPAIDGGTLDLAAFRGGPVLLVNTASRCMATPQYDTLQAVWERYRDRGLTVVGVPSDSFGSELDSSGAVKDFCELNFSIDFPMTAIVAVTGPEAHPVFAWAAEQGAGPTWNFHKILLDGHGRIAATFPTLIAPDAPEVIAAIEALLPRD